MRQITLILLLIVCNVFAQKSKPVKANQKAVPDKIMDCNTGTTKALTDFNNGIYQLGTLGQKVDEDFHPFFIKTAKERYNIQLTHSDCVVFPQQKCYNTTMREKVLAKFGNDIEDKIKTEALLEYKNSELYKNIIKPKIDSGFTYANGRSYPLFPGGETAMRAFIKDTIRETKSKAIWRSIVTVIIEKDGTISNISFYKEPEEEIKNEILRIIKLMPPWFPATHHNKKISQKVTIPFFSKKSIAMREKKSAQN